MSNYEMVCGIRRIIEEFNTEIGRLCRLRDPHEIVASSVHDDLQPALDELCQQKLNTIRSLIDKEQQPELPDRDPPQE